MFLALIHVLTLARTNKIRFIPTKLYSGNVFKLDSTEIRGLFYFEALLNCTTAGKIDNNNNNKVVL